MDHRRNHNINQNILLNSNKKLYINTQGIHSPLFKFHQLCQINRLRVSVFF